VALDATLVEDGSDIFRKSDGAGLAVGVPRSLINKQPSQRQPKGEAKDIDALHAWFSLFPMTNDKRDVLLISNDE